MISALQNIGDRGMKFSHFYVPIVVLWGIIPRGHAGSWLPRFRRNFISHLLQPENGGNTFLRNFGDHMQDYTASQPVRPPQSHIHRHENLKYQPFLSLL